MAIKTLRINLNDNENKAWAITHFNNLILNFTSENKDLRCRLTCSKMKVEDPKQSLCSDVITFDNESNCLECSVLMPFSLKGPMMIIDGEVSKAKILFAPRFIKKLFQYLLGMGDFRKNEAIKTSSSTLRSKRLKCKEEMQVRIKVKGMILLCLHHEYNTPFIKGIIDETIIGYKQHADHSVIWTIFGDISIFDMTNYPSTISPTDFKLEKISLTELESMYTFTKLVTVKPPKDTHNVEMFIYNNTCACRIEKDIRNFITVKFGEVWMLYVQEVTFRRAMSYILDQILYSLSPYER